MDWNAEVATLKYWESPETLLHNITMTLKSEYDMMIAIL